jgi:hypothetical protein
MIVSLDVCLAAAGSRAWSHMMFDFRLINNGGDPCVELAVRSGEILVHEGEPVLFQVTPDLLVGIPAGIVAIEERDEDGPQDSDATAQRDPKKSRARVTHAAMMGRAALRAGQRPPCRAIARPNSHRVGVKVLIKVRVVTPRQVAPGGLYRAEVEFELDELPPFLVVWRQGFDDDQLVL